MNISFTPIGWEDYQYWQQNDKILHKRVNQLIKEISRTPFDGIGKPEPLKFDKSGSWSRRINQEHRLVYQAFEGEIIILACRFHYK
ncbi:MAG: Txe/YoeB family addiction module toxin [Cyclobacteriaceae bacterium]